MPGPALPHRIRPAVAGDVAFIASTWKQSFWRDSPWGSRLRWPVFSRGHGPIVQQLIVTSAALVACDTDREEEIFGYLVFDLVNPTAPAAVHFAYTKAAFRRAGIFRALLAASGLPADLAGVAITHATRAWLSVPASTDRETGAVLREARHGLDAYYPLAVNDPYRALDVLRRAA